MTQMGIQVSSDFTERHAVALIQKRRHRQGEGGAHLLEQEVGRHGTRAPTRATRCPRSFDWDKWLGVAAERPFIQGYYHPGNWRKRRDFGTGTLGDMGCHMFSGWFRALDLTAPLSVKSTGPAPPNADNWAINGIVEYTFQGTEYTADEDSEGHLVRRRPACRRGSAWR